MTFTTPVSVYERLDNAEDPYYALRDQVEGALKRLVTAPTQVVIVPLTSDSKLVADRVIKELLAVEWLVTLVRVPSMYGLGLLIKLPPRGETP